MSARHRRFRDQFERRIFARGWSPGALAYRPHIYAQAPAYAVPEVRGMGGDAWGMRGMDGNAAEMPQIEGAVSPDFAAGKPGIYVIRFRQTDVPLSYPQSSTLDTKKFNDRLRVEGVNGNVTSVRYVGNGPVKSSNWAQDVLDDVFGKGSGTKAAVSDRIFEFTVAIYASTKTSGLAGVQFAPLAVTAIVLTACAVVLRYTFDGAGPAVVEFVKKIGESAGSVIRDVAKGAADAAKGAAIPVLLLAAAAAVGIMLLKKSGARVTTKQFGF